MHSSVKERVIFQMTGGCCILFASQFCIPSLLAQGHQTNREVVPQAVHQQRWQREDAELTARLGAMELCQQGRYLGGSTSVVAFNALERQKARMCGVLAEGQRVPG